ncbi:hypothetical protein [Mesobacillus selenatarsenatis]|uniref:Uncharacterized protein n=1 Tax=Mesobacillus selenatarsenatis (strain DSM 18680 / JCM 14380 / FERM P-15431 / SF-1) TaxID=1321606 RepID=A0A0A8X847_MESS1|nr:hypothetical protein [Mesobacillus selenatarsenatis]GAM15217.1 hypothetical protein SAMD00020551_3373 [Mesobacillus selenatarsenatis SF-1]
MFLRGPDSEVVPLTSLAGPKHLELLKADAYRKIFEEAFSGMKTG